MYWPIEKSVSTVAEKFVVEAGDVGEKCVVKKYRRAHEGIVAAIGKQIVFAKLK